MPNYVTQIMLGDFGVTPTDDPKSVVVPFYIFLDDGFTYESLCTNRSKFPLTAELRPQNIRVSGWEYNMPPHLPQTLYNYTPCPRSHSSLS
mmetsp:Transcript_27555/g.22792  ORF Transcript_27555/g.22792 Transcript_27555/m.22792 type:complete len:91 (+) Transcript_27555:63-335(+)